MNKVKKISGLLWMLLAPCLVLFLVLQAYEKISSVPDGIAKMNTALQWGIIIFIFIPISIGLAIFGYYAFQNDYEKLTDES